MISGIHSLIDGALIQNLRFENIANNVANISTTAFKRDVLAFNQVLSMSHVSKIDFTPGPLTYTGNKLDVALDAPAFFKVQTPNGIRYTQNGSFTLSADQSLVTLKGDEVLGENGPIQINGTNVSIEKDGQVFVDNQDAGKISLVNFKQPELLKKEGVGYFIYQGKDEDVYTAEEAGVHQGYIEKSNVNATEEMIKMVEALRAFESAQNAIQVMDDITSKMVNDVGILK